MIIPEEFNDIRPYEPEELPAVYDRLVQNPQFLQMVSFLFPEATPEIISQKMHECKTNMDFQLVFAYRFLKKLISKASTGLDMDVTAIDNKHNYTFMSNHRDIVLDSALLDVLLIDHGFETTCEIAIGDNLLSIPWVLDVVRLNKSFIVKRGLMARERLQASQKLARYMHFAISEKHQNLWIAQREGRAKDSDDRTQKGILKMLVLGGEGDVLDRLVNLHIVPLAISYEYDPCDFLKAQEYQLKRDDPNWKKGPYDDIISMRTGILGLKGKIHYHVAACIDATSTVSVSRNSASRTCWTPSAPTSTTRSTATTASIPTTTSLWTSWTAQTIPTTTRRTMCGSSNSISKANWPRSRFPTKTRSSCASDCSPCMPTRHATTSRQSEDKTCFPIPYPTHAGAGNGIFHRLHQPHPCAFLSFSSSIIPTARC